MAFQLNSISFSWWPRHFGEGRGLQKCQSRSIERIVVLPNHPDIIHSCLILYFPGNKGVAFLYEPSHPAIKVLSEESEITVYFKEELLAD